MNPYKLSPDVHEIRASLFRIEAGDFGYKGDTYYVITVKDKKFQSEPAQAHRIPSPVWNTNIQFTLEETRNNDKSSFRVAPNLTGELKIVFWSHNHDSWKLKKDKYLGEASFTIKDILLNATHNPTMQNTPTKQGNHIMQAKLQQMKRPASGTSSGVASEDILNVDPDTVPAESAHDNYVRLYFEMSGYRAILFLLQSTEQSTQVSALKMLQELFDIPKSRKAADYVQEHLLKQLKKMSIACAQAPPDPKVVELLIEIASTYNKLLKRDDETLLLMVKLGVIKQVLVIIKKLSDKQASLMPCKASFMDLLKNFFKFVNHQEILIERGALKLITKWIQSRHPVIQTKAYEIILKFDSIHQPLMIKEGILNLLANIITGNSLKERKTEGKTKRSKNTPEKSKSQDDLQIAPAIPARHVSDSALSMVKASDIESIQMQTKTLAVIQYFDAKYKQEIVSCGIVPQLMKLLDSGQLVIQLKTLAVLHHFHDGLHDLLISEGLLRILHRLMQNSNTQLQLNVFSTLQLFTAHHPHALIEEGILRTLVDIVSPSNTTQPSTDIKQKALDLISQFEVSHLIKSELLQHIVKLATTDKSEQIQDRAFDILVKMTEPEYQDIIVQQGILDDLLSIVAVPTYPSDEQDSQAFIDEATSAHHSGKSTDDGLDIIEVELEVEKDKTPTIASHTANLKWACTACTFLNEADLSVCAICEYPKPTDNLLLINDLPTTLIPSIDYSDSPNRTSTADENTMVQSNTNQENLPQQDNLSGFMAQEISTLERILENEAKEAEEPPVEWACPACTFFNNAASIFCEICETPKPQPSKSIIPPIVQSPSQTSPPIPDSLSNADVAIPISEHSFQPTQDENANPYSVQQQQRALEVLRRFDVPYQSEMIHKGVLKYLKKLIMDPNLQQDVLKTIANFNAMYHEDIIKEGILIKMCQALNHKNAKQLLSVIESFEGYQEELFIDKKFIPLMKLLSIDNFLVQPRICQFILNLHRKYWDSIIAQLNDILSVSEPDANPAGTKKPSSSIKVDSNGVPIPPPLPRFSKLKAGSFKSKLSPSKTGTQGKEASNSSVNYALISFAKQLLWQVEHHGIHLLEYKVIYCDGGQSSKKLGVNNILTPQSTVYSTIQSPNPVPNPVNIVLRFKSRSKSHNNNNNNSNNQDSLQLVPYLTHVFLRAPKTKFESPLRTAAIFVSGSPPDIKATKKFDKLTREEFGQFRANASQNNEENSLIPLAFLETDLDACAEAALPRPVRADYVHIKLLTAAKQQFDVEYIGFAGITMNPAMYQYELSENKASVQHPLQTYTIQEILSFEPENVDGISSYLGVKRRIKRFEYKSDFDSNGVLYWIGSDENEKAWTNPNTVGQITLITSHSMYSLSMRVEDIVSRTGGTSTYWGGSAPQYFILDLKQRKLLCNYFTLRHGYQAANSYIQNWELSGSNDCVSWAVLFEGGDTPFSRAFDVKSWPISDGKDYFRYFRVLQKGNYSMGRGQQGGGSPYLCVAGFELYGELQLF